MWGKFYTNFTENLKEIQKEISQENKKLIDA